MHTLDVERIVHMTIRANGSNIATPMLLYEKRGWESNNYFQSGARPGSVLVRAASDKRSSHFDDVMYHEHPADPIKPREPSATLNVTYNGGCPFLNDASCLRDSFLSLSRINRRRKRQTTMKTTFLSTAALLLSTTTADVAPAFPLPSGPTNLTITYNNNDTVAPQGELLPRPGTHPSPLPPPKNKPLKTNA